MSPLEVRLRALLRWYPRSWRQRHGDVMLATLLDDAEARGRETPTRADAWSIRTHGLAERATPRTAAGIAAVGAAIVALAVLWQRLAYDLARAPDGQLVGDVETWRWAWLTLQAGVGPLCIAVALVMLASWRRTSPTVALVAIAGWAVALSLLTASALWTIVEPIVSADGTTTTIGVSSTESRVAAVALVAVATLPLVRARIALRGVAAWPTSIVVAVALAVVALALAQTSLMPFVAILVVMGVLATTRRPEIGGGEASTHPAWPAPIVGTLAVATIVLALPATVLTVLSATEAVVVDAAGMRAAVVLLVAGGLTLAAALALALRPRLGWPVWLPASAFGLATVTTAAAAALAPGRPAQEPLLGAAAVLAGLGVALLVAVAAPGGVAMRCTAAVVVGATSAVLLGQTMGSLAGVVWLAAVPLLVVALGRRRRAQRAARAREDTVASRG